MMNIILLGGWVGVLVLAYFIAVRYLKKLDMY
jgi:hypothetical protein